MQMYAIICECGGEIKTIDNEYACPECGYVLTDEDIEKLLDKTYKEGMKEMNKKHVFLFDEKCIVISSWDIEKTVVWYMKEVWSYVEGTEEYQEKYDELLNADSLGMEDGMWWTDGELGNVEYYQNEDGLTFGDLQSPEGYVEVFTKVSEVIENYYSGISDPVML